MLRVLTPAWCPARSRRRSRVHRALSSDAASEGSSGGGWVHEIKFERLSHAGAPANGQPAIYTRRGYDWTLRFQTIADVLAGLRAKDLILDGEPSWRIPRHPDFGLLHADRAGGRKDRLLPSDATTWTSGRAGDTLHQRLRAAMRIRGAGSVKTGEVLQTPHAPAAAVDWRSPPARTARRAWLPRSRSGPPTNGCSASAPGGGPWVTGSGRTPAPPRCFH